MKKPLIRIVAAAVLALLLCQATYTVTRMGLDRFETHKTERLNELINGREPIDLLFIGSSRTHTTIHPGVIDSILGSNSYNAGVEGGFVDDFLLTYNAFRTGHKPPKVLVLTLDIWSLQRQTEIFNYIQYFPYSDNPVIASHLKSKGYDMAFYNAFPFLAMSHYDDYTRFNSIKGFRGQHEIPEGDFQYKGYLSNGMAYMERPGIWTPPHKKKIVDLSAMNSLVKLIETCRSDSTQLIFTYAPEYKTGLKWGYENPELFFTAIDSISKEYRIPFERHDKLPLNQDPKLFANPGHVNIPGATAYSVFLANYLRTTGFFD